MSEQPGGQDHVKSTREVQVDFPSSDSEKRMAIRRSDWERLRRRIRRVAGPPSRLAIVYAILFGVAATALFSIYPMTLSQGVPTWVIPTYVCAFVFTFLFAWIFVWLDRKAQARSVSDISDVMQDMEDIEGAFSSGAAGLK